MLKAAAGQKFTIIPSGSLLKSFSEFSEDVSTNQHVALIPPVAKGFPNCSALLLIENKF